MQIYLLVIELVSLFLIGASCYLLVKFHRSLLAIIWLWLTANEITYDQIPESYATEYQSGGGFRCIALSYKGFGTVRAPGDLDHALRRVGDMDRWPAYIDEHGTEHPAADHVYTKEDFYWDRRTPMINYIFGKESGIVYMGPWIAVRPKYYELRIHNFRTVKPSSEEVASKKAEIRNYYVGEGDKVIAGYLLSWNENTKRVLLADDIYPFPVDGVRIGVNLSTKDEEGVVANILLFLRARVIHPYLYLQRSEDTLETIQNEIIQHVRQFCAGKTIKEVYAIKVTLESDKADQENPLLMMNGFGEYMRTRYGFLIKGASFGFVNITGKAGEAITAPYVARQNAEATAIQGDGDGRAEASRLRLEGAAFDEVIAKIGLPAALALRNADVGEKFATSGQASTVVLGLNDALGTIGSAVGAVAKTREVVKDGGPEPQQPAQ